MKVNQKFYCILSFSDVLLWLLYMIKQIEFCWDIVLKQTRLHMWRIVFVEQTSEFVKWSLTVCRTVFVEESREFGEGGFWRTDLIPNEDIPPHTNVIFMFIIIDVHKYNWIVKRILYCSQLKTYWEREILLMFTTWYVCFYFEGASRKCQLKTYWERETLLM